MSVNQSSLKHDEILRYSQQLKLEEVGVEGQLKLKNARVLCIGAGGLGSPLLLYLAAAGIGTLGIVDSDAIEISNLHRQILYKNNHVGSKKTLIATQQLNTLNPTININIYPYKLIQANAEKIIKQYDIVADCTDNFTSHYLINDICFTLKKPHVFAALTKFTGQCSLFLGKQGPCYRCLFPLHTSENQAKNCEEEGVIGVLPGLLGIIQANEILKWVLQIGNSLAGRVLMVNSLEMKFTEFQLQQDPACELCVHHQTIEALPQLQDCSLPDEHHHGIAAHELKKLLNESNDIVLVDVRTLNEHKTENIGGILIPLPELSKRLNELTLEQSLVVYCQTGTRSMEAVKILVSAGFHSVKHLQGGMLAWKNNP